MPGIHLLPNELLRAIMVLHAVNMPRPDDAEEELSSPTVMSALGVSRLWRDMAYSTREYWQDIVLTPTTVPRATKWAERAGRQHIRLVVLYRPAAPQGHVGGGERIRLADMLRCADSIAAYCESLAVLGNEFTFNWIKLSLSSFSALHSLCLCWPAEFMNEVDGEVQPSQDFFDTEDLSVLPNLSILDIEFPRFFMSLPPSITSLHISEGPQMPLAPISDFANMLEGLPQLQSLYIQGFGWEWEENDAWDVAQLQLPNLICLEVNRMDDNCSAPFETPLCCFLNALRAPLLQRLRLHGISFNIGQDLAANMDNMSAKCPQLRKLFLSYAYTSGTDLKAILLKFSSITELVIWNCDWQTANRRAYLGALNDDNMLPNLAFVRIMDGTFPIHELLSFLGHRACLNLSCPRIECGLVLDEFQQRLSIEEIQEYLSELRVQLCNSPNKLMGPGTYHDIHVARVAVTSWLSEVNIRFETDLPRFIMNEFANFAPERLGGSRALRWYEACMGLGVDGMKRWQEYDNFA